MNIVDLTSTFAEECEKLEVKVLNKFTPDIVVPVKTGGLVVFNEMQRLKTTEAIVVTRQRKLTKAKGTSFVTRVLSKTPVFLNNLLRIIEVKINEFVFSGHRIGLVKLEKGDLNKLKPNMNVLIVDDAIDSGSTIRDVIDWLSSHQGELNIKVCCINNTQKSPVYNADFILYRDTIVRYPWAADARK